MVRNGKSSERVSPGLNEDTIKEFEMGDEEKGETSH
jgi:hypothetical protein